jgi:alkylation response protein AidB-like acyl-CoA dehydrogenase
VIVAGAFNPAGSITAIHDGYRVEGRWGFASGCEHADWIYGNCVEGVEDGHPHLRAALFTPADIVVEDTWTATGLCATASHHFRVGDLSVPAHRTFEPLEGEPCIDEPIARIHTPALISLVVSSVALGIARAALGDVAALAGGKVPMLAASSLATNPLFQPEFAVADVELSASRRLLHAIADETWATSRATDVVDTAHRFAGGTAVYAESPLQRRLRDIHTLAQHFIVRPDTLTTAGAVLNGQQPGVPIF